MITLNECIDRLTVCVYVCVCRHDRCAIDTQQSGGIREQHQRPLQADPRRQGADRDAFVPRARPHRMSAVHSVHGRHVRHTTQQIFGHHLLEGFLGR